MQFAFLQHIKITYFTKNSLKTGCLRCLFRLLLVSFWVFDHTNVWLFSELGYVRSDLFRSFGIVWISTQFGFGQSLTVTSNTFAWLPLLENESIRFRSITNCNFQFKHFQSYKMNPFWARSNVKPLNWLFAKNISFESKSKAKNGLRKLISSLQRLFGLGVWPVDTTTKDIFDENLVTHPSFFLKCFKTILQILY